MNESLRQHAIETIRDCANKSDDEVFKAVFDLRHNAQLGDERFFYPLLEHTDAGVVAWTLYSLVEVFDKREQLSELIRRFARGDSRDSWEMPIQSMAISLLAEMAGTDSSAGDVLREVAEDSATSEVPRSRAWKKLAGLHGMKITEEEDDEMIMNPDGEKSEQIRARIRQGIISSVQQRGQAAT